MKSLALLAVTVTVVSNGILSPVFAADTQNCDSTIDYEFYRTNRVIWKDECKSVTGCTNQTTAGAAGITAGVKAAGLNDLQKSDTLQKIFQGLLDGGMNAVQAAAVMGNMYTESLNFSTGLRFSPTSYEGGVDTPASGFGLVQWTNTKDSGYKLGRRTDLENYAVKQGVAKTDLNFQISFILKEYNDKYKALLANGAFGAGTNVTDATTNWMRIYEVPLEQGNDPAHLYSERIPAAKKIYGFYGDLMPVAGAAPTTAPAAATDATAATCGGGTATGTTDSAVAGDIVATALGYAWPDPVNEGVNAKTDAKPTYQQDKPTFAPDGNWSDCGAFVATVMIASKTDLNFPILHVAKQADYVKANPDKYKIILNAQPGEVQPGDLLIENNVGHIEIAKGGTAAIDASNQVGANDGRVPSVRPTGVLWLAGRGFFIARFIGGAN